MTSILFKLYISTIKESISCLLVQDVEDGFKRTISYLSLLLSDVETRYTLIEKIYVSLYYAYIKLEYYMLPKEVLVICKVDIVKYLLSRLIL